MAENNDPMKRHFRCEHCNGLIVIPVDLPPTKGPCPHCKQTIESPGPSLAADRPPPAGSLAPLPRPEEAGQAVAEPKPPVISEPVPAGPAAAPEARDEKVERLQPEPAEGGGAGIAAKEKVVAARLQAPEPEPEPERMREVPEDDQEAGKPSRRGSVVAVVLAIALVVAALGAAVFVARDFLGVPQDPDETTDQLREDEIRRTRYLRVGWKDEARETLAKFLAAKTVGERVPYTIGGESLAAEMEEFYGGSAIDDSDTPVDAFSAYDLRMEDRERGMFLMIYDLPPQFDLGEFFRPLATLEVQYQVEPPGMLLSAFARAGNFVSEPVRVQAFFLGGDEGMRIDWHVFVQTKYRLMRQFLFSSDPGRSAVFRVMVGEDVPEGGREETGMRSYRVSDPVHRIDSALVQVPVDSEVGRLLSAVNWRGGNGVQEMRSATVELGWEGVDDPRIVIRRFLCWEFLGLGGQAEAGPGEGG